MFLPSDFTLAEAREPQPDEGIEGDTWLDTSAQQSWIKTQGKWTRLNFPE